VLQTEGTTVLAESFPPEVRPELKEAVAQLVLRVGLVGIRGIPSLLHRSNAPCAKNAGFQAAG